MSNWYSKVNINLKNNKNKQNTNRILEFLTKNYDFKSSKMKVLDNNVEFYGDNGNTIVRKDKPGYLPDVEEIYTGICLAVKECDIEASIISECSVEDGFNEYKLNFQNKRIIISVSPWVWEVPFYNYENYEEFCEDFDDEISEEEFEEALENDYIFQDEEYNFYSEVSLQENFQTLIDITIDELISENPNKDKLIKIIRNCGSILQYVNPKLQNDKEFILKTLERNYSFDLKYVSEELKNDKDIVLASLKSDKNNYKYIGDNIKKDQNLVSKIIEIVPEAAKAFDCK